MLDATSGGGSVGEITEVVKDAGALDFKRGMLKLGTDSLIFAPSTSESRIFDLLSNLSSVLGAALFFYDQYETSFESADRYPGYQNIPYESIEAVSVIGKGKVNEVCIDSSELPEDTYWRIRIDEGSYIWPIYDGNKKYAKKIGAEILSLAKEHGGAETFNAAGVYSGPTSHIPIEPATSTDPTSDETSSTRLLNKYVKIGGALVIAGSVLPILPIVFGIGGESLLGASAIMSMAGSLGFLVFLGGIIKWAIS